MFFYFIVLFDNFFIVAILNPSVSQSPSSSSLNSSFIENFLKYSSTCFENNFIFLHNLFQELFFKEFHFFKRERFSNFLFLESLKPQSFITAATFYEMEGLFFAFCGTFFDQKNVSTYKWVRKFEHEMFEYKMNDRILSNKFMEFINLLFIDKVEKWFESHSKTIKFLKIFIFHFQTVTNFKILFYERFFFKTFELISIFINTEFQKLKQRAKFFLAFYYKKTINIM